MTAGMAAKEKPLAKGDKLKQEKTKDQLKNWLKNKGHAPEVVDGLPWDTEEESFSSLLNLQGISAARYDGLKVQGI